MAMSMSVSAAMLVSEMTGARGCGRDALGVAGLAILMDSRAASSSEYVVFAQLFKVRLHRVATLLAVNAVRICSLTS